MNIIKNIGNVNGIIKYEHELNDSLKIDNLN